MSSMERLLSALRVCAISLWQYCQGSPAKDMVRHHVKTLEFWAVV